MSIDRDSARYKELFEYYHRYYAEAMTAQGAAVDPEAQNAYAAQYADEALTAETAAAQPAPVEAAAPSAPVQPAAPAVATAPAPKKPLGKGVKYGIIGGAAALMIALIAVAAVFIANLVSGGSPVANARVVDMKTEPKSLWTALIGEDDEHLMTPWFQALPNGNILAIQEFSYSSWHSENVTYSAIDWYEGIEADYQAGFDAGLLYDEAMDAYWDDFSGTVRYPEWEDYAPSQLRGVDRWAMAHELSPPASGAMLGFDDAYFNDGFGYSLPARPVRLTTDPASISVWNAETGKEEWSTAVSDVLESHEPWNYVDAFGLGRYVIVSSTGAYDYYSGDGDKLSPSSIAVLQASDGSVVGTLELDENLLDMGAAGDKIAVLIGDPQDDSRGSIQLLDPAQLDSNAGPTIRARGAAWLTGVVDGAIGFASYADSGIRYRYYSTSSGDEVAWGDGGRAEFIDGTVVTFFDGRLSGWNRAGERQWRVSVDQWNIVDGRLFAFARCDSEGCGRVDLLDARTGESKWDSSAARIWPMAIVSNRVLVAEIDRNGDFDDLAWYSLSSGEELSDPAPGLRDFGGGGYHLGESMLYISEEPGELTGYNLNERRSVWTFDYDEAYDRITRIGNRLFLWSESDSELSLLGVR